MTVSNYDLPPIDSSEWIRRAVLERELADIESRFSRSIKETQTYEEAKKDSEEFLKNCYVCEYIREQLGEMK
jgi:hypothetical protein|tara:strand:- start:3 stop:218 length:216 start_codon:yes stop_codon:yes gene_type:complete